MKSKEVRANWAEVLRRAENGETIVVEHYNRPAAMIIPYRPKRVRANAHTYNNQTRASITISGLPTADAIGYPDPFPSAIGYLVDGEWIVHDGGESEARVTGPDLATAIQEWAGTIGHHLSEIVIDPIYPPDPDAGPNDW